jgi:multidrug efflux pump subunit AcrB
VQRGDRPVRVSDLATIVDTVHPKAAEPLQIGIHFQRGANRDRAATAIGEALRTDLPAGVTIDAAPPVPRPPRVTLIGDDRDALAQAADRVARELVIVVPREPMVEMHVDRERAADLGISARDVARLLGVVHGVPLARVSESADLVMRLDGVELARVRDVLRVRGAQGALVPLSAVVTQRESYAEPVRVRIDRRPAVELAVPDGNVTELRRRIAKLGLPAQILARVQ